jgi:Domain of Unknown Function (DUF748).
MRLTDGTLELARPILDAPRDAGRPAPSPATAVHGDRGAAVGRFRRNARDRSWNRRARRRVVRFPLDAHRREARRDEPVDRAGEKAHVKLAFVSEDRIASFPGEADVDPTAPTATGRFEFAKFSLGLLYPYYGEALDVDVQKGSLDLAARSVSIRRQPHAERRRGHDLRAVARVARQSQPAVARTDAHGDRRRRRRPRRKVTFGELKSRGPRFVSSASATARSSSPGS